MPLRLRVTSSDLWGGAGREAELPGQPQPVGGVAGLELRIEAVRGLEVRRAEGPAVALEPVPQGGERAVDVHPLAQVAEDLLPGPVAVQRLQPGPLGGLRLADEAEDRLGKDRPRPVEAVPGDGHVAVRQQMCLDHGLESLLPSLLHQFTAVATKRPARWPARRHSRAPPGRLRARRTGSSSRFPPNPCRPRGCPGPWSPGPRVPAMHALPVADFRVHGDVVTPVHGLPSSPCRPSSVLASRSDADGLAASVVAPSRASKARGVRSPPPAARAEMPPPARTSH